MALPAAEPGEAAPEAPEGGPALGAGATLLLRLSGEEEGAAAAPAAPARGRRWDAALLGPCCRWRSCLERAGGGGGGLCAAHRRLKAFLDAAGAADSARFLPKRPPAKAAAAGDGALVRAASSLLTEIGDGELFETIRSFCRRCERDASARERRRGGRSEAPWARWRDADAADAERRRIEAERQALRGVLAVERGVSGEVARCRALRHFPRQELLALRREGASGMGMFRPPQGDAGAGGAGGAAGDLEWARRKQELLRGAGQGAADPPGGARRRA